MSHFKKTTLLLLLIITVGASLRFYKLDWGQGLFAHPDEYHIVISVNQLSFPAQMNPHFFNYGTVVIYLIYFTKLFLSSIFSQLYAVPYTLNAFLIGRFYSALFSTLSLPIIYLIAKKFMDKKYALLATILAALTPGLIQQAHFLTPESALIFFLLASLFFVLHFLQTQNTRYLPLAAVSLGLGLAVKVSAVVFLPVIFLAIIARTWPNPLHFLKLTLITFPFALIAFFLGAPFVFFDFPSFWQSFQYESGLAIGKVPVFYTRQFIDTIPVLFQFEKIYPYALGPALLVSGLTGFFLMAYSILKPTRNRIFYLSLVTCHLSLFLTSAFLFAKWTRFSSPIFPFFAIFSAFFLFKLSALKSQTIHYTLYAILLIPSLLWTLAFFSIYLRDDVRVTANKWLEENTALDATFLVEGGNTVDVPLYRGQKLSLDFYQFESNPVWQEAVYNGLISSDYFIVESRRVFANHQRLPKLFPRTAAFYDDLFSGKSGFKEIKRFTSYPLFPDENAEETWSVFDHPVIRIFKKI
ncbi:hypothetical protein A2617_01165 [Candidatus Daviesbacteria bacterium RIFOXYD1_FULL_41_10]|uniref:Glycosyltransferase RgtA/B/C/D-like domain-containing protein n=1 Tax=Candidatus Daviesbacteria bacterium RIFOXYD1_FULL_41_10 TaxID=1797801 RepID=A0A1F5N027_9BACT|nr:MAG: hypothetical protein A2617_01165 [Candidatus Daviesbacteria bacterium RIFOXYD1_FULL_41_10]